MMGRKSIFLFIFLVIISRCNCNPIQVKVERSDRVGEEPTSSTQLETASSVVFLNRTKYPSLFQSSSSPHRSSNGNSGQFSWSVGNGGSPFGHRWKVPTSTTPYHSSPFSIHTSSQTPPSISSRIIFPNDPIINFKTTIYPGSVSSRPSYGDGDDQDITGGPREITRYNNIPEYTPPTVNLSINPSSEDDDEDYTDTPNSNNTVTPSTPFPFPDDHSNAIYRSQVLMPPIDPSSGKPSCISSPDETFCESVNNYPKIDLKKDIKMSMTDFREIFGSESIEGRKTYQDDDDLVEERVCRRIPKIVYPQMARNQANQWVYIVNDVEYVQAVVSEICEREGKPCNYMDNLPDGTYSRCRQKYSYKKLLAIHPTEQRTYTDTFSFPSCCACYVKGPGLRL